MIMDRIRPFVRALQDLVTLKDYRDWHGKTPEYLEKKPLVWQQARDALDGIDQLQASITELEGKIYLPGHWSCPKCHFYMISTTIHGSSGRFSPNDKPQTCVNDCGPMWKVTHEQSANTLVDRCDLHAVRVLLLEAGLKDLISSCQAVIDNEMGELGDPSEEIIPYLKNRVMVAQSIQDGEKKPPPANYH